MSATVPETPADRPAPRGLVGRIAAAWSGRHREVIRADLAGELSESRLLAYAMGAGLLFLITSLPGTLAWQAQLAADPEAGAVPAVGELVIMQVVANLFFLPLFLYGVAAVLRLALRLFGGSGGWQATRLAVFWAPLAAAPATLVAAATASLLQVGGAAPIWAEAPGAVSGAVGLWFLCAGLAEAHGFRRAWPVFVVILALWAAYALFVAPGQLAATA